MIQVLAPDRSTTAGRRKSFQRGRSVTPEDLEDQIDIEDQRNCQANEDIQIVQVHKGTTFYLASHWYYQIQAN